MDSCHATIGPLVLAGIGFLLAVLWLDGHRLRFSQRFAATGSADDLKWHLLLNIFVALGALCAAAALVWTSSCAGSTL